MTKPLLVLVLLLAASASAAIVSEQEPNSTLETANLVQCGDTVYCAELSPANDVDHFRFWVAAGIWRCFGIPAHK
jgi:hypothetical protein